MNFAHLTARRVQRLGLLLACVVASACGGSTALERHEAEAHAAFLDGQARADAFLRTKSLPELGPTESHLVSVHRMKNEQIKEMYEATRPVRMGGQPREGFRNALNESAMHLHLAELTKKAVESRGGAEANREAMAAAESSVWEALRAAREVIVFAEADPSQANAPEMLEANATFKSIQAAWPSVHYEPGRNFLPAGRDGG